MMCERNVNQLPLARAPTGDGAATQACALTRDQTSNASVRRLALNPLSQRASGAHFMGSWLETLKLYLISI